MSPYFVLVMTMTGPGASRVAPLLILILLAAGCRKDPRGPQWDVDILAPLVTTSLTIRNLVADSLLVADPDGQVTLLYSSQLFAVDLDTLLQAPDTSFDYRYGLPFPGPLNFPAGFIFFNENDVSRFDLGDIALRYLRLREGTLDVDMTNMLASKVLATFTLPGAALASGPAILTRTVGPGSPASPTLANERRDLAGAVFDLRGPSFNSVNTLTTNFTAQLDTAGNGATVTSMDSLIAVASYRGLVPQYARGYFGSRTIGVEPAETTLDLFRNIVSGTLDLDQATLRVKVLNGLGADIQVDLDHLQAVNSRTGSTVDLTHAIFQGPINLGRALDLGNGFQPTLYQNTLDNNNSNVDLFLENLPDKVRYAMDLKLNPLGDISNGNDFLYFDSKLRADLELEVPLRLIANELTLQTFAKPDLPGSAGNRALRSGKLMVFADNGFPFGARLEIDIVDDDDQVLGSVTVEGWIASGIPGPDGFVHAPTASRTVAQLDAAQLDQLYAGGRFRIRAAFTTADPARHVQLLERYRMDLRITVGANYMVNGKD